MNENLPFDPVKEASLLSAYVDGELTTTDVARIEAYLNLPEEKSGPVRREINSLREFAALTGAMRLHAAPPEEWEVFWRSVYNRRERSLGWLLLSLGLAVVTAWGVWEMLTKLLAADGLPWPVKGGALVTLVGLVVLVVSVVRERRYKRARTRYKDIIR